nr:reverse transcriptase domain-containing protein [Tanacetum cinerariifolium]
SYLKAITTRSGVSYDGPQIPPPPSFLSKVVENELEATKDTVTPPNTGSTEDVQPLCSKPNPKSSIPYSSRRNNERNRVSLKGAARIWLEKEPPRSIFTWDDLVLKFINQFFPSSKTTNLRNEITNFQQRFDESFSEAWDRFKDLLRAYPHHGFSELHQLDTFYNALNSKDQDSLNSVAGGNFLDKIPRECLAIIESKSKVCYSRNKPIVVKVVENEPEAKKDTVNPTNNGSTKDVQPPVVQSESLILTSKPVTSPISEPAIASVSASKPNPKASIPYPSRRNDERNRMAECLALVDLGASINLIPFSVWKRLSLPDLTPTCMTLELVDRSISRPIGVAEDVYVKVEVDAFFAIEDEPTSSEFYQPYLDPEGDILILEAFLNDDPPLPPPNQGIYLPKVRKKLKICEAKSDKFSIGEPLEVELKDLPPHLEYAFLEGDDMLPVIIAKDWSVEEKTALIT